MLFKFVDTILSLIVLGAFFGRKAAEQLVPSCLNLFLSETYNLVFFVVRVHDYPQNATFDITVERSSISKGTLARSVSKYTKHCTVDDKC
jgi:hypothetical protein